jgi:hypothetical protein
MPAHSILFIRLKKSFLYPHLDLNHSDSHNITSNNIVSTHPTCTASSFLFQIPSYALDYLNADIFQALKNG